MREITATFNSHVFFSTPNWKEEYAKRVVDGMNGEDGKDGIDGPEGKLKVLGSLQTMFAL